MRTDIQIAMENCEREPIEIPGSIQPHGMLMSVSEAGFEIEIVSDNCKGFLGVQPEELIGRSVLDLLDETGKSRLHQAVGATDLNAENPIRLNLLGKAGLSSFECIAHRFNEKLILEFEEAVNEAEVDFKSFYYLATKSIERLRSARNKIELYQRAVDEVRRITGFDRVVIYKFDETWNGHVIVESRTSSAHTYLDLHFPASDIPKRVRDLYYINPIRMIPSTEYTPARLKGRADAEKLDLSLAILRGVSPIHVEYLKNMEVTASMSLSILKNSNLWGLISCSHETGVNSVSFDKRALCLFLASTLSSLLPQFEDRDDQILRVKLNSLQNLLIAKMSESDRFVDGLFSDETSLLEIVRACGAASFVDGSWRVAGKVPNIQVLNLIREHMNNLAGNEIFATENLRGSLDGIEDDGSLISGCLGFSTSKSKTNYFLWFRPEVVQAVTWGGNPNKPVEMRDDKLVLHPRKSFERWKETVRGKCLPWLKEEIAAAENLRLAISDVVLQRVEQITRLNAQLERSNVELDSFAYAASHDLKEPIRGISNFAGLILKDYGDSLPESGHKRMQTILRLTQRSEDLINSLLGYSQIGRQELVIENVNLNEVVRTALDTVATKINESQTQVRVSDLGSVLGDRTQLNEVFTNLIINAIKYNESPSKRVVIERAPISDADNSVAISVSDNGIGIDPKFHQQVFKIFRRLHPKDSYGGGSGTGLAIVKNILDRHGASISIESTPGSGSKFIIVFNRAGVSDSR